MTTPLVALSLGFLGLVVGSFVALLTVRLPAGLPVLIARSRCMSCDRVLAARDMVPVLSYLSLRGRCRRCAAPISPRYCLVELAAAAIGAMSGLIADPVHAVAAAVLGWSALTLAILDWEHFWLPDRLTIPLGVAGVAASRLPGGPGLADSLIGGLAGFLALAAIAAAYRRATGRVGLGGGDAKLLGALGAWLGWRDLPYVLLLAALFGLAFAAVGRRPVQRTTAIPFGPWLAAAGWLVFATNALFLWGRGG